MKKIGVVVFPGSNCDHDILHTYSKLLGQSAEPIWHRENTLKNYDLIVIPGGFAYGDYLRTGAIAKLSPVMNEVKKFAAQGRPVIGVCNGFQILCETGLLPGALLQNIGMRFLSQFVHVKVEQASTPFTRSISPGTVITCPIAHFEGNFYADASTIEALESEERVLFRYCTATGEVNHNSRVSNPNGAINSIAGICNASRNVVGLMPHPERSAELLVGGIGGETGRAVFSAALENLH